MKLSAELYQARFDQERQNTYPEIDNFETLVGYALDRDRLEEAARVLACPVKANPPNWQHGRLLYTLARQYLTKQTESVLFLDIGTAKGFSALCLKWALMDADADGEVVSVDVINPHQRQLRNSVAEFDGAKTLAEILAPWPEAKEIKFLHSTGVQWLAANHVRVNMAFVDGKHTHGTVLEEGYLLARRQVSGDVVVFDDVHLKTVRQAIGGLPWYHKEFVNILPQRAYAIAVKI